MKRSLARQLSPLDGFEEPDVELEQYATSPELAANLIHLADLEADLKRTVIDLGTGPGILAIAAATRLPPQVIGIDIDRSALELARSNERTLDIDDPIDWLQADATQPPLDISDATVVMNPPFGAQHGQRGADKAFLDSARTHGVVSYSIHNSGSKEFIESYAADHDGRVTHAFAAELPVDAQFEFHSSDRAELAVEVFRIEWPGYS